MSQLGRRFGAGGQRAESGSGASSSGGRTSLTVSQVIDLANRSLESGVGAQWIEGEVSGLHLAQSGHAYFTLKDAKATLSTAIWRSSVLRLRFALKNGQRLLVQGKLAVYPAQGRFQLYAERAEPVGQGALMLEFEQRKAKLAAEGLFEAARKRAIPRWPQCIGVVTSPSGAAIHDILTVLAGRCPSRVLLSPALVQGESAAPDLGRALSRLWNCPDVEVIIIGRGGGSVEDLWAFNDEALARLIVASPVPVISAVGHETDFSISDMVADLRAATPSHAAELVVPNLVELAGRLAQLTRRLACACERRILDRRVHLDSIETRLERVGRKLLASESQRLAVCLRRLDGLGRSLTRSRRDRLARLEARLARQHPRAGVQRDRARLDRARARLATIVGQQLAIRRARHGSAAGRLNALSPLSVLERGYAVVTHATLGVVRDASQLAVGERVRVRLAKGSFIAELVEDS